MEYTVEIREDEMALESSFIPGLTAEETEEQAELYAAEGSQVFVTWFRGSDDQHGYLNRDGHGPVGKAW